MGLAWLMVRGVSAWIGVPRDIRSFRIASDLNKKKSHHTGHSSTWQYSSLRIMVSFTALALAVTAITGVLSSPLELIKKAGTPSSTGTHNGFYYSFWTDGGGNVNYVSDFPT